MTSFYGLEPFSEPVSLPSTYIYIIPYFVEFVKGFFLVSEIFFIECRTLILGEAERHFIFLDSLSP